MTHRAHLYSRKIRKNSARVPPVDVNEIAEVVDALLEKSKITRGGKIAKSSAFRTAVEDYAGSLIYLEAVLQIRHDSNDTGPPVVASIVKKSLSTLEKDYDRNREIVDKIQDVGIDIYARIVVDVNSSRILSILQPELDFDFIPEVGIFSETLTTDSLENVLDKTRELIIDAMRHEWVHLKDPVAESSSRKMRSYPDVSEADSIELQLREDEKGVENKTPGYIPLTTQEREELSEERAEILSEYHSHETEVRAFLRNIIDELEDQVKPETKSLDDALKLSQYWKEIKPYLDTPSRNYMLKALYTWFYTDRPKENDPHD